MADRWAMTEADTQALCGVSAAWLFEQARNAQRFDEMDLVGIPLPDGRRAWCEQRPIGWVCAAVAPVNDRTWGACWRLDHTAFWSEKPLPSDYQTMFRLTGKRANYQRMGADELIAPEGALVVAFDTAQTARVWQVASLRPDGRAGSVRETPGAEPVPLESVVEGAERGWTNTQRVKYGKGREKLWLRGERVFGSYAAMQSACCRAEKPPKVPKPVALGSHKDKYPDWPRLTTHYGETERETRSGCKRTMAHVGGWKAARRGETQAALPFSSKFPNLCAAWRAGWEEGRESLEILEAIGE